MNAMSLLLLAAAHAANAPQPAVATEAIGIVTADIPAQHARTAVQPLASAADRQVVGVTIAGQAVTLELRPHSLRSADFQLLVQDASGVIRPQPAPLPKTYRGAVREWERSAVAASFVDGKLTAQIRTAENGQWMIQPALGAAAAGEHVVFARDGEAAAIPVGGCGVTAEDDAAARARRAARGTGAGGGSRGGSFDTEVSFDADFEFYQLNGSSVTATVDDIETIMVGVDDIYRAEVGIQYVVNRIIVRTAEPDPYTSTDKDVLLGEFEDEWDANHGGQERDVAHLMTGKNIDGTTIGYAWVGVVCDVGAAYGFSQSRFSSNMAQRVALTAHELGHNWDAGHCDGAADCWIMCSSLGGCAGIINAFGGTETAEIVSYRDGVSCLGGNNNTVYVDDSNNSGSEDGTSASPYNTLREGLWAANPGATIIIRGGNYDFERTSSILNRAVRIRGEAGGGTAVIGQ